ncbi:MAG TPA: lipopolysaccharide transport periplasmic protein LptA [Candidatus Aphodousia faecipullorum]|nr:lipopolysaccharide transport periplasmic protein LptA [Candidatus Aphodousia faecipullorum]
MKKFTILALILTLASNFAYALSSDRNQPIRIQADHFLGDEIKQTATYTGNVRVDQGTMRLTGKRLELVETAKGYHVGTLTGNLATFRQKRDPRIRGVEEWISGHAQKIVYEEQTGVITLTGDALVERSENGVIKDRAEGSKIIYDTLRSRTIIQGNQDGRARTVIAPRNKQQTNSVQQQDSARLRSNTSVSPR